MARLLVIEDNAASLELMTYLLAAAGHDVEGCRDGRSGLDAVRRRRPDLVLCDIQLPRLSGYDIAREVRGDASLGAVVLLAVTALAMSGDREKVLAAGFHGYIAKPIQPEQFAALVDEYLPRALRRGPAGVPAPAPARHAASAPPIERPAAAGTVLAVDDVPNNLRLIEAIFEGAGYRVLTARGMAEAMDVLRRERVDLVLSDVHMAGGDGFALRRAAAAEPALADLPFVFLSSSAVRDEDRRRANELGECPLLERPIEPRALIAAVQECLRRRRRAPAPDPAR